VGCFSQSWSSFLLSGWQFPVDEGLRSWCLSTDSSGRLRRDFHAPGDANQTLNVQSFMGIHMAIRGRGSRNAILLIIFARSTAAREKHVSAAAISPERKQAWRTILMTRMGHEFAGMIPHGFGNRGGGPGQDGALLRNGP